MDARLTRTRHNFIVIFLTTPPLIANLSFLLLAVLPSLPQRASCSVDQRFQNCSLPTTCGGLEIAYPFYIQDQQPSYCGFLGFSISCRGDRPILSLSGHEYLIHHIFYRNQSLLVSDATLSNYSSLPSASCAPRDLITILKNLTLPETQFQLNHTVSTGLSLLYDCNRTLLTADELLRYEVTICSGNGTVLGIYEEDGELAKTEAKSKCAGLVEAAVEANWSGRRDKIEEALGSGFMLSWLAADCSLCDKSGGKCGFDYQTYHFNCYCPDRPHALHCVRRRDNLHLKIGLGIGIGGLASLTVFACIYVIRHRRWRASIFGSRPAYSDRSMKDGLEESNFYFGVPIFTNRELEEATHYFDPSRELGDGGFGTVYYGKLKDGREVAVKRLYEHNYRRVKQFMTEVQILTRLRHKNLVSLYGYTSSRSRELLLVYEYISNGTVSDHLHGERAKNGHLPWPTRMNIAMETATALTYLHASGIIHRDVKTDNILLDQNFSVKVADFGLSRLLPSNMSHISTAPQGTPGYVDPEYHQCYQLSEKSDVYSFGVVLVELISSMPAVDISRDKHEINLANLATNKIRNCTLSELIDPNLGFESDPETRRMIMTVAELAFKCLEPDKDVRPSMNDALEELKAISDGTYESDKLKIVDVSTGRRTNLPPSPECDATVLLKNVKSTGSPVSVTEGWGSSVPSSAASVSS